MRRILVSLVAAAALAVALAGSSTAHECPAEGESPSVYAEHHIVALAQEGELGADAHIPGTHQGIAGLCPDFVAP
jgi:hypothetical protein